MATEISKHRVRDISVRMRKGGTGEPLIFLHGSEGLPDWLPFFEHLAGCFQVILPEHPGFGASDNPPWIRNVADLAMYYLDFIDELGAPNVHLAGHSLGGWVAAELAVRNTGKLATLSLLAPAGVRVKGVPSGDNFIWSPEELARNLFHDQDRTSALLAKTPTHEEADLLLTNRFMAAKFGWEPRWYNPALERWLHRITIPTLLVWGEDDKLLPSAYAKAWCERISGAKLELVPQCGHMLQIERADAVARAIVDHAGARAR